MIFKMPSASEVSWLHIVLAFLFVEFTLLLCSGILVLLIFGHKIVHVALGLGELHLVHTLSCVPVQECLAAEHSSEVLSDSLEHLLDCCGVASKSNSHLETLRWDIADAHLDVVRDPLDKVRRVLVLDVEHLLITLFGGHTATEECCCSQVTSMAWVSCTHHVLGIKHLLSELRDGQCTVLLRTTRCKWGEASHEEVQAWEWDQVDSNLAEIAVELTWEAKAACDTTHGCGDEMIQVSIGWGGQLQRAEADVIEGLVVKQEALVSVLNELVEGEHCVVRLHNSVRHLWGWDDTECFHDTIWVLLTDLGNEESAHTCPSATTKGVAELEALEAVAAFSLFAHNIKDAVDELGTLGVVTLGPVVAGSSL